jgi:hypothetical protein
LASWHDYTPIMWKEMNMETLEGQLARLEKELRDLYRQQKNMAHTNLPLRAIEQSIAVYQTLIAQTKERIQQDRVLHAVPFDQETRRMIWGQVENLVAREYMARLERIARAAHTYRQGPGSIYAYEELTEALSMVPGLVQEEA